MHFIDFELATMGTYPYAVSNVVSIDGSSRIIFFDLKTAGPMRGMELCGKSNRDLRNKVLFRYRHMVQ